MNDFLPMGSVCGPVTLVRRRDMYAQHIADGRRRVLARTILVGAAIAAVVASRASGSPAQATPHGKSAVRVKVKIDHHVRRHTAKPHAKPHRKHRHRARRHARYDARIEQTPMAVTGWMEARNQDEAGRRAALHVIKNRYDLNRRMFGGNTLRGVCHKKWQYSAWNANDDSQRVAFFNMLQLPETHPDKIAWRWFQRNATRVFNGADRDNTGGAVYYHTGAVKPAWRTKMVITGVIGSHIFYREPTARDRILDARDMRANRQLSKARATARRAAVRRVPMTVSHQVRHAH